MKGDRDSAYKIYRFYRHIPGSVWLPFPTPPILSGMLSNQKHTQIFGSVSPVLHYNVFSKLIAQLSNLILWIPILAYVGDFGALVPLSSCAEALGVFKFYCNISGVKLKESKRSASAINSFWGYRAFSLRWRTVWRFQSLLRPRKRLSGLRFFTRLSKINRFPIRS